jgi:7 transmembrane receptor (rhodopsin family)
MLLTGVLGFLLNAIAFVVIVSYPPMRHQMTNVLIANLAAIDAMASMFLVLHYSLEYNQSKLLQRKRLLDEILCRIWYSKAPLWGLLISSTYGIVALSFERYLSIVHPHLHRLSFDKRKVIYAHIAFNYDFEHLPVQ